MTQVVESSDLNLFMERSARGEIVYKSIAVRNQIFHVLGTLKRQRKMRPRFGSYLNTLLFRPRTAATANEIQHEIFSSLTDPENELVGRIEVDYSNVAVSLASKLDTYNISISPTLLEFNVQETYQFSLTKQGR